MMKQIRYSLWAATLLLFILHLAIAAAHTLLLFRQQLPPGPVFVSFLVLLAATGIVLAALFSKGAFKQTRAYAGLCACCCIFLSAGLIWMVTDDPAVKNDYSREKLIHKANGSFPHLDIFNRADTQALESAAEKINSPDKASADVAWEEIRVFRDAINTLDRFDRICDLPLGADLDADLDMDTPFLKFTPLNSAAAIHGRYFLHNAWGNDSPKAAAQFCGLYRVAVKGMKDATLMINKMIFAAIVERCLETAWAALHSEAGGQASQGHTVFKTLQENFSPLNAGQISLKRPMIAEYLIMKHTMHHQITPANLMNSTIVTQGVPGEQETLPALVSTIIYHLGFKPNKSLEDMKTYFDLLIGAMDQHPVDTSAAKKYMDHYARQPRVKNMIGWILNSMAMPDPDDALRRMEKIRIKSDLLAHAIHEALGQSVTIPDFYTGQNLRYKTTGNVIIHPGRDSTYGTGDDIVLGQKNNSY